jgi:hypothetical protein
MRCPIRLVQPAPISTCSVTMSKRYPLHCRRSPTSCSAHQGRSGLKFEPSCYLGTMTTLTLPESARADCQVGENGIPEEVMAPFDIGDAQVAC